MKILKGSSIFLLSALLFIAVCLALPTLGERERGNTENAALTSEDAEYVEVFAPGGTCEYVILVSSGDNISADVDLAKLLKEEVSALGGSIQWRIDTSVAEGQKEILLGNTDRELSKLAQEAVEDQRYGDALVWCVVERGGQIAYTANSNEAFMRGQGDLLSLISADGFKIKKNFSQVYTLSREDYEKELESEKEMEKLERIEELKNLIGEFTVSDFGDCSTSMEGSTFGAPNLYPVAGEHPRLNLTAEMLPKIKEYMDSPEAKYTAFYFWKLADTAYDGKLPPATYHPDGNRIGWFNMDEEGLAIIEAKSLAYLLTGDELYAYEAILAMKNYLTTIDIQYIHSDQCREFGRIIYCTAIVYDWCYPVLSADDMAQFRMAVADIGSSKNQNTDFGNQMEVGFPPKLGTVVSSHSSEHQVLRDYLSIAIAVFDEAPDWYEWVAGMIYNYYVPFREYYFQTGTYPQGVNIYAPHRFDADLWSVWMLYCSVGEMPYDSATFARITHSFFEQECPDGSLFSSGDGDRAANSSEFWHHAVIAAALFGDDVLRARAASFTNGFSGYDGYTLKFSFSQMLILSASYFDKTDSSGAEDLYATYEPVSYLGSPLGQMTVREKWSDTDAAAVFMKLGERTTANHEHEDIGTFQIYYKGLYTGDSGKYAGYGSAHWYYYSSTTVAHNGLLISNPSRIGENPSNAASYYYSGSQRKSSEATDLVHWLETDRYKMGEIKGAAWGYKEDGTADFAYLGGDISAAYEPSEVAYVGRNMLTYYTGNPDAPMYLIVYDKITSVDESYKKTFLLHTTNEPVIDAASKTVQSVENGGRLVLKSLLGADSIVGIGGVDENGARMDYAINGRQCETGLENDELEKWGRVEISPDTDALTHHLLNFMYVTDADSELMLEPTLIDCANAKGVLIDKNVFIFADTEGEKNTDAISFSISGKGLHRVMVTGLYAGTWDVFVDGISVAHAVSSEGGSVISFYAPTGDITVMPGKDIVPSNGGRIIYNAFGGKVPDDAPLVYEIGVPTPLPTDIENGCNSFVGWYTSPNFEEETRITEVLASSKGNFNIYAKYKGILVDEDYEKTSINIGNGSANDLVYNGKTGSNFKTVTDEKRQNTYLRIYTGSADPNVDVPFSPAPYLYGGKKVTLSVDLAKEEGNVPQSICRIRGLNGSGDTFPYFTTTPSGLVKLGDSIAVMELTEGFQTLAVTLDFETGTATAYNRTGDVLGTVNFTAPASSGCADTASWLNTITSAVNWWMGAEGVLLIDNLTVYAGDYVPRPIVLPEGYSSIKYVTNGGFFVSAPDDMYKEGEVALLNPNIKKGQDQFLGWYTTPDFKDGTKIAEISAEMTGEIVVYAKWAGKVLNVDFEGKDVHFEKEVGTVDGLGYNGTTSAGAYFETRVDESGNTYAYWYRGSADPQIKYEGKANSFSGRHVITYKISLATTEGETPMEIGFAIRSTRKISETNAADRFTLFSTDTAGNVKFANGSVIATLSPYYFTTVVVSVDFENSKVTAYDPQDGSEIASVPFVVDNYEEWLELMNLPLYARATNGESIRVDNVSILCAPYGADDDVQIETTMGKIDYVLGGGSFTSAVPNQYKKGESLTLPIPTRPDSTFLGWYLDDKFKAPITEITAEDTDNFILYAKWQLKVFELSPDTYPDLDVQGKANGAGANNQIGDVNFQTQGSGGCYTTMTDENGERYILWKKGTRDPQLIYGGKISTAAAGNLVLTFKFTMAQNGSDPLTSFVARMRTPKVNGTRMELHLLTVSTDGSVHIGGDKTHLIGTFGAEFKTLGVAADFANEKLYGYDENGALVAECAMKIPSIYMNGLEFYDAIAEDILGLYAGGTAETSIRIGSIVIETGNTYEAE